MFQILLHVYFPLIDFFFHSELQRCWNPTSYYRDWSCWIEIRGCFFILFFLLNFLCVLKCNDFHCINLYFHLLLHFWRNKRFLFLFQRGVVGAAGTGWCSACSYMMLMIFYPGRKKTFWPAVDLPSCEEVFKCSRRSQPNTFSLLPPFLRTLLILPFCDLNQTRLSDDDANTPEVISTVLCCRCFCLVCYRTWCRRQAVSGSFAALESLDHSQWLATRCIARFISRSAKLTKFETAWKSAIGSPKAKLSLIQSTVGAECSALHFLLMCSLVFSLSNPEAPPMSPALLLFAKANFWIVHFCPATNNNSLGWRWWRGATKHSA